MRLVLSLLWTACLLFPFLGELENCSAQGSLGTIVVSGCSLSMRENLKVSSTLSGKIVEIPVVLGQKIGQGTLLVRLDSEVAHANYRIAEQQAANDVEYRYAVKAHELARKEYERAVAVNTEIPGARSQNDIEQLRLAAERAQLQIEQARHHLSLATMNRDLKLMELKSYDLIAPETGQIGAVHKRVGEYTRPGEVVIEIFNASQLQIEGFLTAEQARMVQPGMRFQVFQHGRLPGESAPEIEGRIQLVEPTIDPLSQLVRFIGIVDNSSQSLRAGGILVSVIIWPEK